MSRYSDFCEKTYSLCYRIFFVYRKFNNRMIFGNISATDEWISAMDASYLKKSGKCTAGLTNFWDGSAGIDEKGLEVSLLSLVHLKSNTTFALQALQTIDEEDKSCTNLFAERAVA